ncbi:hypothetical protein THII_0458 [Thioploca ingrica]|uniref:Uncharacterized protein n=1 Tax=Thioploca ingrica TaxID=40754 RepID=A0A090AIR8_9GAMM|nr:hypothetical protein THII_0458 [Thioploca ingrica]
MIGLSLLLRTREGPKPTSPSLSIVVIMVAAKTEEPNKAVVKIENRGKKN